VKPEEIARQRAVIAAATEGPWSASCPSGTDCRWFNVTDTQGDEILSAVVEPSMSAVHPEGRDSLKPVHDQRVADATFTAEARTCWPAALDEVERLRARVAELEASNAEMRRELSRWYEELGESDPVKAGKDKARLDWLGENLVEGWCEWDDESRHKPIREAIDAAMEGR